MKYLPRAVLAALLLLLCTFAYADGVMNGETFKNGSHTISVEVVGTVFGDQNVTITEGLDSGQGTGTPTPDQSGCEESEIIYVGVEAYRVHDGDMEWRNSNGIWVQMQRVDDAGDTGDNNVGSMPTPIQVW